MKVWIDLVHLANVNFFKNTVKKLKKDGHDILITCLRRGKLPKVANEEFPDINIEFYGSYGKNKLSIIFNANLFRLISLIPFIKKNRPDVGISVVSYPMGVGMKFFGLPNIQFDDDPERKQNLIFEKLFATEVYFPPIVKRDGKFRTMNALKEWAYLSPKYFNPSKKELAKYKLKPQKYFFIREVSTDSFNYQGQKENLIASIANEFPSDYKVLLSLEDKNTISEYPDSWILLEEPIKDIHSLMYYSNAVISSGDSMAREGALLGVPSIYCGNREMKANKILIDKGRLFRIKPSNISNKLGNLYNDSYALETQREFRLKLLDEWEDITDLIINSIYKYKAI